MVVQSAECDLSHALNPMSSVLASTVGSSACLGTGVGAKEHSGLRTYG